MFFCVNGTKEKCFKLEQCKSQKEVGRGAGEGGGGRGGVCRRSLDPLRCRLLSKHFCHGFAHLHIASTRDPRQKKEEEEEETKATSTMHFMLLILELRCIVPELMIWFGWAFELYLEWNCDS